MAEIETPIQSAPSSSPAQLGGGVDVTPSVEKVNEIVGENANENGGSTDGRGTQTPVPAAKKDAAVAVKVEIPEVVLPSVTVQIKRVESKLKTKIRSLKWKSFFMRFQRGFQASALEAIAEKIRALQAILERLARATAEQITQWYKQYVLGVA